MRKLRIATSLLREAAGDKELIDAIAFAILIKQQFVDSCVKRATYRRLKELFGLSNDRIKKLSEIGLKRGLLRFDENRNLHAAKLHDATELSFVIDEHLFVEAAKSSKNNRLKLTAVRHIVQAAILTNHVNILNSISDTHNGTTEGSNVATIRKAKRTESRMLKKPFNESYTGLSNARIQQLIGRKRSSAIKTVKTAIKHKLVSKQVREKTYNISGSSVGEVGIAILKEMGDAVYRKRNGQVVFRFSNEYRTTDSRHLINPANHGL